MRIRVENACTHNLDHLTVEIPRASLTVITGVSGSGKSSLAFDTLYAEGQRRFVESMSIYARQYLIDFQDVGLGSAAAGALFAVIALTVAVMATLGRVRLDAAEGR